MVDKNLCTVIRDPQLELVTPSIGKCLETGKSIREQPGAGDTALLLGRQGPAGVPQPWGSGGG